MKKELFAELLASVKEAAAMQRGQLKPSRIFKVQTPIQVARIREKLGLSQTEFARLLGISANTLQNWEQGRRKPAGPARVLLRVAEKHPEAILQAA